MSIMGTMAFPFCSVIVLNYNGKRFIEKTLSSLSCLNYPKDKYEIIIVDNASQDNSKNSIEKICANSSRQPPITNLFLLKNIGFAGGNNKGIAVAKGEYILLLNNDCIVDRNWLQELVNVAEKDKNIFAVGSKTYLRETNKIQNAGILMFEDGYGRDIGAAVKNHTHDYEEDRGQFDEEKQLYAACAVAVLYRKSILDQIGYLDESSFMYYEDVEISERARMHGYEIRYAPKAVVRHHHAASSGEWSPFFIYHSEYGRLWHMFFWFPQRVFWREYLKFAVKAILRLAYGIKKGKLEHQRQYIKAAGNMFLLFPTLFAMRRKKMSDIDPKQIEQNYQSIKTNKR